MPKLKLDRWESRPYGERTTGVAISGEREVPIVVRRPPRSSVSGDMYVMANGWTAGKNSMRIPAIEATKFGHIAITFEYTNTSAARALPENVSDVATVIDAMPTNERRAALGLSMGGAVITMALLEAKQPIDHATLVAPGMYLKPHFYTAGLIAKSLLAETTEAGELRGNLLGGARLLAGGLLNILQRPQAVRAEFSELMQDNVHDELRQVKSQPDAPFMRLMYGLHDQLLPAYAQAESVEGLPFDHVLPYEGGHARLAYDPTLSGEIFTLDLERELAA